MKTKYLESASVSVNSGAPNDSRIRARRWSHNEISPRQKRSKVPVHDALPGCGELVAWKRDFPGKFVVQSQARHCRGTSVIDQCSVDVEENHRSPDLGSACNPRALHLETTLTFVGKRN